MASITIRHTRADGTLIEGSSKGDGVYEILKGTRGNWRYFPSLRQIGLGQSRDKMAKTWDIGQAAEALRNAGHVVTVEIDEDKRRDMATIEADRAERAEARAERYEERAERRGEQASADYARARQMAEAIPLGQPVMPDHYSYRRDMNYRAKIDRTYGRAFEGMNEAEELSHRADSAKATQSHRESIPATLRRIAKLEAEERSWVRALDGKPDGRTLRNRETDAYVPAHGRYLERVETEFAAIRDQLAYWRGIVAKAQANGVKVWSREDFTKGDYIVFHGTYYEVLRVSAKSVTIPAMINDGPVVTKANGRCTWTDTIPYDKVKGRKSAAEMAVIMAEVERREQATA